MEKNIAVWDNCNSNNLYLNRRKELLPRPAGRHVAVVGNYLLSKDNNIIVASKDTNKIRVHHLRGLPVMKQDMWRDMVPDEVYRGKKQVDIKKGDFLGALPE